MVSSPCIKRCVLEPGGRFCLGCGRSLEEIAAWTRLDDEGRRRAIRRAADRLASRRPAGEAKDCN